MPPHVAMLARLSHHPVVAARVELPLHFRQTTSGTSVKKQATLRLQWLSLVRNAEANPVKRMRSRFNRCFSAGLELYAFPSLQRLTCALA